MTYKPLKLTGPDRRRFFEAADEAVRKVTGLEGGSVGQGCYIRLFLVGPEMNFNQLTQLAEGWVGGTKNQAEDLDVCLCISMEKACRLVRGVAAMEGCVTSYAFDRNPAIGQYGGATLLYSQKFGGHDAGDGLFTLLISASGLKEPEDTAVGLITLNDLGWVDPHSIPRILDNDDDRVEEIVKRLL